MERKKTVQELITALKTLRLQEADLTAQLEEAIENREEQPGVTNEKAGGKEERNSSIQGPHGFSRCDRIWIKNKLHKPASWNNEFEWIEKKGKTATVTDVLIKGPVTQIHFITDNGVKTWRAPNNLCLLAE